MSNGALSATRLARMHSTLAGHVERGRMPGLISLVSRRGETHVDVIGSQVVGQNQPMRRDTIFRIASLTKPVIAAATMLLIERCKVRLDQSVEDLLPELANRQVLRQLDSELDETVPAKRSITLRDLLTSSLGFGSIMAMPGTYPIQKSVSDFVLGGDGPPIPSRSPGPDEYMRRLGSLPLIAQPGTWLYDTSMNVLGILLSRATGQTLEAFLQDNLFGPLGMKDAAFSVPADKLSRLAGCYAANPATGALDVYDDAGSKSDWSKPPAFQSGSGGLVATVDDYLAFCSMLLNQGRHGGERILSRPSVELMMTDQVAPEQRAGSELFFGNHSSWGFGGSVDIKRTSLYRVPGRYGWDGGLGLSAYTDPCEQLVGILFTQRLMDSPEPPQVFEDFWTSAYQAIDD
jgi:CubicO group peptidase (beta-lactamase class C family)